MTDHTRPARLAELDQVYASLRDVVSELAAAHRGEASKTGREVATAQLANILRGHDDGKVASIAAVAMDLLAHADRP